jgi:hypothetical protein
MSPRVLPIEPVAPASGHRLLLWFCLVVFWVKNPTALYQAAPVFYKGVFAVAGLVVVVDYVLTSALNLRLPRFRDTPGLGLYALFFVLTILVVVFDALLAGRIDAGKTVQFFANTGQFFLVVYLVYRLRVWPRLVHIFYRIAVVLAALALGLWVGNMLGVVPPRVEWVPSPDGALYFYPPFGMSTQQLPIPINYRSFSIFTEPAYCAFFLTPYALYAWHRFRTNRRRRDLLAFVTLLAAAATTLSVAGAVALAVTLGSLALYYWLDRPSRWWALVLLVLVVAAAGVTLATLLSEADSRDNELLLRRYDSISDRLNQWQVGWSYAREHVFGNGIGYAEPINVYREDVDRVDTYAEFTNVLNNIYYLGLIYAVPLGMLFLGIGGEILRGLKSASGTTRTMAVMIWYMLIYNASVEVIFTAYFLTFLAAYRLRLRAERFETVGSAPVAHVA